MLLMGLGIATLEKEVCKLWCQIVKNMSYFFVQSRL